MRFFLLSAALLVVQSVSQAQTTPGKTVPATPTSVAGASDAKLDGYLLRWEQEMRKVNTLAATLARIDKDKTFGTTRKYTGGAQYMKSGTGATALNMAALELKEDGKADVFDKFVCTGSYIYQFLPAQKELRAYEMPKPRPGQVADDNFMGFLFGMKAEEAKRRYALSLYKEDAYFIYVDVLPRFAGDKADFARARLVLNKDSFLPRQLWFEHANGSETTWDIPRLQAGATIDRRIFDAPRTPAGWKLNVITRTASATTPSTTPPRVVRPSSKAP